MKTAKGGIDIVVYECKTDTAGNWKLRRFIRLCKMLEAKSIFIKRYSYKDDLELFKQNEDLWRMISCAGREMLPATYINGKIKKIEGYPTRRDIYGWLPGLS